MVTRFYPGVKARIIVPFLLAIIAIAGLGVFIVTRLVAGSIQERFTNQLLDSANAAVNTIVDVEREQLAALRQIVFTEGIPQALQNGDSADLDTALRPVLANSLVDELLVFNAAGDALLHLVRLENDIAYLPPATPPPFRQWGGTQRVLAGEVDALGDKFVDVITTNGATTFYFSAPVLDDDGLIVGGALLGLRASTLAGQVTAQALASVTFNSADGAVISSTFRTQAGLLALEPAEAAQMLEAVQGDSPVVERSLNGVPYQVLYAPFGLRSQPIGLLSVGLPSNFVVEQSSTSREWFGLLFGVFFIIVGGLGLVVARTITLPIERLVNTTRAIRAGDLSRRVALTLPDELGELGTSFDQMTDQLVSTNEEIRTLYDLQVQETRQREAILTSISDAVIVQDDDGQIILYNRTAALLMSNPQDRDALEALCRKPETLSQPQMAEFAGRHFSVLATPVQMESGELLGFVIVFRDITALVESEALKDEMVLQMSHELRTPLSAVRGFVDLVTYLDADNLSPTSTDYIGKASAHLNTLERLVNQVVDVSAMIANRFDIYPEPLNFADVLCDAFERWTPVMQAREHHLSFWTSADDIPMQGDPKYLDDLLDYLLQNAHDYTLPGGFVALHAEVAPDWVTLSVMDNGVGIAADEQEQVFERMFRGRSAEAGATDARGMGLGLYMSRQIVEAHDGTITLESTPDTGTTVTVWLPLER